MPDTRGTRPEPKAETGNSKQLGKGNRPEAPSPSLKMFYSVDAERRPGLGASVGGWRRGRLGDGGVGGCRLGSEAAPSGGRVPGVVGDPDCWTELQRWAWNGRVNVTVSSKHSKRKRARL